MQLVPPLPSQDETAQNGGMRFLALLLLVFLSACAQGPGALGITGPRGAPAVPAVPEPTHTATGTMSPEVKANRFAPSMVPTTNGGRYWGYN